jgi:hypothetical protein
VVIAAVVASVLVMQIYMKRGFSGKLRAAADAVGEQYAPKDTNATFIVQSSSDVVTTSVLFKDEPVGPGQTADVLKTTTVSSESATRTGNESVGPFAVDLWN